MVSSPKQSPTSAKKTGVTAALPTLPALNLNFLNFTDDREEATKTKEELLKLHPSQLEALADAFQEHLIQTGKVHDHQFRSRTVPQCFAGEDAVGLLLELIQEQSSLDGVTRGQALQVGRDIQTEFQFFSHISTSLLLQHNHNNQLQDTSTDFYQFENNLPMQVYQQKRKYPSLWDKVTLLENRVPLKDHWGLVTLKWHSNAFLAKEAVDVLMETKLVKSRKEAVYQMCKLNEKVHCCRLADHPGNDGTHFKDDTSVYIFVPKDERIPPSTTAARSKSKSPKRNNKSRSKSPHKQPKGPAKDAAYFQDRASGIRSRLDQHRQERAANTNAQADNDRYVGKV